MTCDSGDESERHAFGVFVSPQMSVWSMSISKHDAEDNAIVGKRLKKMKQAISRSFEDQPGLQKIDSEQVRFESMQFLLSKRGKLTEEAHGDVVFLCDGFGMNGLAERILRLTGLKAQTQQIELNIESSIQEASI